MHTSTSTNMVYINMNVITIMITDMDRSTDIKLWIHVQICNPILFIEMKIFKIHLLEFQKL